MTVSPHALKVMHAAQPRHGCTLCPAGAACLTADATPAERIAWHDLQREWIALPRAGKRLYAAGEPATALFVVRAGCIKTFTVDEEGNERVRGFFYAGDVVGLDALGSAAYPAYANAVTAAQVCRIAKGQLQHALGATPGLLQRLLERMSMELRLALAFSGNYTADQRVAAFLILMKQRLAADSAIDGELKLPMTRRDIANHLRLATETVCRVLARFESAGWLDAGDRILRLRNREALRLQAEPVGVTPVRHSLRLAS